jgi:hypothetical protein
MANKKFLWGMLVTVLTFCMAVVACNKDDDDDDGGGSGGVSAKGVQLYNPDGSEYTGTGSVQDVNGILTPMGGSGTSDIGKIGTISPDGKLTLDLPATVADDKLFTEEGIDLKLGVLSNFRLKKGEDSEAYITYFNKDFSEQSITLKKGWNYFTGNSTITDVTGYKWFYAPTN